MRRCDRAPRGSCNLKTRFRFLIPLLQYSGSRLANTVAAALSDREQVRQDAEKGQQERVAGEQGREKAKKLHQELEAHGELSKLALNPNILTLVALIRRSSPNAKLPERRVDLYKEVIPLFLHRRDEDRDVSVPWKALGLDLDDFEKISLVACLALAMHEHGAKGKGRRQSTGARTVPEDMAVRHLREQLVLNGKVTDSQGLSKAKKLLHWLEERPGLLRLTDDGVEFTHLGYQEYLAAVALKERHQTDKGLLAEVLPRLMDDWWNEPLRLLLTLLAERAELLLMALASPRDETKWQRRGRGLALAMGALQEIPAKWIPIARPVVLKHMDGLLGRETQVPLKDRVETLLALGQVGDPRLGLEKEENWIWLPPGEFYMGSEDGAEYEKPVHQVTLTQEFHLSRFPVTNHDFKAFIDDNGYRTQAWWSEEGWAFCHKEKLDAPRFWANARWSAPNQPVVGVSWYEAEAFCRWMTQKWSSKEGRRVARLPSEAEWEYAARGKEGRRYPWGNDEPTPERANYGHTGIGQTSPVGAFPLGATPEGVHDMAGNVWEWCGDWYGKYPSDTHINPSGLIKGSDRVLRGGSWFFSASNLRGAGRNGIRPSYRDRLVGFRVVWSASRGAAL